MKAIIHGTLRFLLAIAGIYMFCHQVSEDYKFSTFFKTASTEDFVGVLILLQISSCFVLYMGINAIRDFMRKRIRMRVMYIVNAILILAIILFGIFGKPDAREKEDPPSDWDFLYLLATLAIIYFMVADFITLFIKKKKKKVYSDQDFETGTGE